MSFCFLPNRGVLAVSGSESRAFLQGLVSNNLDKLSMTNCIYAALLTPQGKFLYEFFITEGEDSLLLEAESARLNDLRLHLARFLLRAHVTLTLEANMAVAVAFGEGVTTAFSSIRRLAGRGVAYIDPRLPEGGVRLVGAHETLVSTLRSVGCREVQCVNYEKFRLESGLPDGSRDLVIGRSGLLEYGFEELNGIDFRKGCYVGQEVMSRSKYRGLVKRRLVPVIIDGPVPPLGTPLLLDNRKEGEMRSAIEHVGLALVQIEALVHAQLTCKPFQAGTTHLTPRLPRWLVLPNLSRRRQPI